MNIVAAARKAHWVTANLAELGELHCGQSPPADQVNRNGIGVAYVSGPEQWDGHRVDINKWTTSPKRIAPHHSVFITVKGAGVGTLFPGLQAAIGRDIYAYKPSEYLDWRFVLEAIRYTVNDLISSAVGDIPGLSKSHILGHLVGIPPLPEQRRIVEAIESYFTRLDHAVATLGRVQRSLRRYRASVLKAAVEGRLVPTDAELARVEGRDYEPASVLLERILAERRRRWEEAELAKMKAKGTSLKDDKWKEKYKEPVAANTDDLPTLPEGWCWASVDQLGEVTGGLTQNSKRSILPLQVPFLRVANVYANELRLDEIKTIGVTEVELPRVNLVPGDLLVVEGNGSIEQIGRVALWDGTITPCLHQNHLIKVRFSPLALAQWTLCWLLAPSGRVAIERAASSTSGLHTLSISKIGRLPVPVAPLAEQSRATAEVDRLTTLALAAARQVVTNTTRSDRVRQSILKWAFEGKLVDQDPTDEPASELLERIKAARGLSGGNRALSERRR